MVNKGIQCICKCGIICQYHKSRLINESGVLIHCNNINCSKIIEYISWYALSDYCSWTCKAIEKVRLVREEITLSILLLHVIDKRLEDTEITELHNIYPIIEDIKIDIEGLI